MPKENLVNVYDEHHEMVAKVRYNSDLDRRHKGLTQLKNGKYVLIYSEQNESVYINTYAKIVSDEEALQEILQCGNHELLNLTKFKRLNDLYKKTS